MLISVNYHYVREKKTNKGIYPLTPIELSSQIDAISKYFEFTSIDDIMNNRCNDHKNYCLLTFDDGLKEQYETAYDVLKRKGISAGFFISSLVYENRDVLLVHKLHYVIYRMDPSELYDELRGFLQGNSLFIANNIDELAQKQYTYDDAITRKFKYILNFVLDENNRIVFINDMFNKVVTNSNEFFNNLYMNEKEIKELASHNLIGSHCHSHIPLGSIKGDKKIMEELKISKKYFDEICGIDLQAISYPYGGPTAVNEKIAKMANEVGYKMGLTMERGVNKDINKSQMLLGRFDTNDVMGGKKPFVNSIEDIYKKQLFRTRYINEN